MIRISIVIATYNRGKKLLRTLDSLTAQTLPAQEWEAVVVDNNSSDNTLQFFDDFARRHPALNMRIVEEKRQGLSWARNRGIAESKAPVIAMIDDDEQVNPGFLAAYDSFFKTHPDAAAAGGKILACYEEGRPQWMSRFTEAMAASTIDLGDRVVRFRGRYPIGGNMAFRRGVFEKYGMFNTGLGRTGTKLIGGEEKDMFRRITDGGDHVYFVPGASVDHIIPPSRVTLQHFRKLARMCGVSERIRTKQISGWAWFKALVSEAVKWVASLCIALWFLLCQQPLKAHYIIIMRRNITKGLLTGK